MAGETTVPNQNESIAAVGNTISNANMDATMASFKDDREETPQQALQNANGAPTQPSGGVEQVKGLQNVKPPASQQAGPAPQGQPPQQHPWAQRIRDVAEVLAGPQQKKYTTDVNSGEIKSEAVPVSGRHLGMAIALEVLSGAMSGMAAGRGQGPGAAFVGGQQAEQQKLQQQQQQQDASLTRQMKVFESNMRMLGISRTMANSDQTAHDQLIKTNSGYLKYMSDNYPELVVKQHVSGQEAADLQTHSAGEYIRVVDGTTPAIGADGKPIFVNAFAKEVPEDTPGAHQKLDYTYSIVRHGTGANNGGGFPPVDRDGKPDPGTELAVKAGALPASFLRGAPGVEMDSAAFQNAVRIGHAVQAVQDDVAHVRGTVTRGGSDVQIAKLFTDANGDTDYDKLADAFIHHESPKPTDRGWRNNNPGNLKDGPFAKSQPGYAGSDGTFAKFNSADAGKNALMAMLQRDMPALGHMSPQGYVETKYSPDSDNFPGQSKKYGDSLIREAGLNPTQKSSEEQPDIFKMVRDNPLMRRAIDKFQGLLGQSKGNREAALAELAKKDDRSAGLVTQLYASEGKTGWENLHEYDVQQSLDEERRKKVQDADVARTLAAQKAADKQKLDADIAAKSQRFLHQGPEGFRVTPDYAQLGPAELEQKLKENGITELPGIFDTLYLAGHYGMKGEDFAQRVWAKGSPDELDRQTAIAFIRKFINPNFNENRYNEVQGMVKAASNPDSKFSQQITSFQQFLQHAGEAIDANDNFRNRTNGGELMNKPISWWKKNMSGDPAFKDWLAATEAVSKEYESFLLNNHALHESDRAEINSIMSENNSPAVAETILKRWAKTAAFRAKDVDDKWHRITGAHFPDFINDEAVHGISKLTDEKGNNPVADVIGDLDNGGNLQDSPSGFGNAGKSVADTLRQNQPHYKRQSSMPYANQNERPVKDANGNILGYTVDGKTLSRVGQ